MGYQGYGGYCGCEICNNTSICCNGNIIAHNCSENLNVLWPDSQDFDALEDVPDMEAFRGECCSRYMVVRKFVQSGSTSYLRDIWIYYDKEFKYSVTSVPTRLDVGCDGKYLWHSELNGDTSFLYEGIKTFTSASTWSNIIAVGEDYAVLSNRISASKRSFTILFCGEEILSGSYQGSGTWYIYCDGYLKVTDTDSNRMFVFKDGEELENIAGYICSGNHFAAWDLTGNGFVSYLGDVIYDGPMISATVRNGESVVITTDNQGGRIAIRWGQIILEYNTSEISDVLSATENYTLIGQNSVGSVKKLWYRLTSIPVSQNQVSILHNTHIALYSFSYTTYTFDVYYGIAIIDNFTVEINMGWGIMYSDNNGEVFALGFPEEDISGYYRRYTTTRIYTKDVFADEIRQGISGIGAYTASVRAFDVLPYMWAVQTFSESAGNSLYAVAGNTVLIDVTRVTVSITHTPLSKYFSVNYFGSDVANTSITFYEGSHFLDDFFLRIVDLSSGHTLLSKHPLSSTAGTSYTALCIDGRLLSGYAMRGLNLGDGYCIIGGMCYCSWSYNNSYLGELWNQDRKEFSTEGISNLGTQCDGFIVIPVLKKENSNSASAWGVIDITEEFLSRYYGDSLECCDERGYALADTGEMLVYDPNYGMLAFDQTSLQPAPVPMIEVGE